MSLREIGGGVDNGLIPGVPTIELSIDEGFHSGSWRTAHPITGFSGWEGDEPWFELGGVRFAYTNRSCEINSDSGLGYLTPKRAEEMMAAVAVSLPEILAQTMEKPHVYVNVMNGFFGGKFLALRAVEDGFQVVSSIPEISGLVKGDLPGFEDERKLRVYYALTYGYNEPNLHRGRDLREIITKLASASVIFAVKSSAEDGGVAVGKV